MTFLLFRFDWYYPSGGQRDFAGRFDSLEEAAKAHRTAKHVMDYGEVYDVDNNAWYNVSNWHPSDESKYDDSTD